MTPPWPDRWVLTALFATLLLVFSLIFSLRPHQQGLEPALQWRDTPEASSSSLQL